MRYRPFSSVIADFTFSISAGLAASTVTPGITAPEVSFTVPVNTLWARADAGTRTRLQHQQNVRATNYAPSVSPNQRTSHTRLPLETRTRAKHHEGTIVNERQSTNQ